MKMQKAAKILTGGWTSEADLWEIGGIRNGWGRTSDLVLIKGMDIMVRKVLDGAGKFSHLEKRITTKEFNRVFGRNK